MWGIGGHFGMDGGPTIDCFPKGGTSCLDGDVLPTIPVAGNASTSIGTEIPCLADFKGGPLCAVGAKGSAGALDELDASCWAAL